MPRRPLVATVVAMEAEAAPLRETFQAESADKPTWATDLPCRLFTASASPVDLVIAVNGIDPHTGVDCIGTTSAALTAQIALDFCRTRYERLPDLLLSAGTAGGWQRCGAAVGDVYFAHDRFVCHDRRIGLPGFDLLGIGNLPAADLSSHAEALGCRLGVVTTGDSLDETATDAQRILNSRAEVKEMEAAAVAWVGSLHGVPVGAVKAITDLVDSPVSTAEQFSANLAVAVEELRDTMKALLGRLGWLGL